MEYFGLIDAIRDYCDEQNYCFIYGNDAYANALADRTILDQFSIIIIADFSAIPTITGTKIQEIQYQGLISVGRKSDEGTQSNLDETPIQKYDRRLKELSQLWPVIVGQIACDNELEISNVNIKYDLNKLDLNADFVSGTLTLIQ